MTTDRRVVQCNYLTGTPVCAAGARAYLVGFAVPRVRVLARSRSGRWVFRWEPQARLHNFRLKTLAADDPAFRFAGGLAAGISQAVVDNLNAAG